METVGIYIDSSDHKLSKVEILRELVTEKLTTALREILAVVETTVTQYECEISVLKRQLEAILQPRVSLYRIGLDDAGSQDPSVNTDDLSIMNKDTGNKDHEISEISSGKHAVYNGPTNLPQQEMVLVDDHLVDIPSDYSVSCPANKEACSSDDKKQNAQNNNHKIKRKRRLPRRYISESIDLDDSETLEDLFSDYSCPANKEACSRDDKKQNAQNEDRKIKRKRHLPSRYRSESTDLNGDENAWTPNKKKKSLKVKKQHLIKLKIGLLLNCSDAELSNNVFKLAGPLHKMMCPQSLSESDFLNELRSAFPELKENQPFEAFLTDSSKKSLALPLNKMTPTELYQVFRSTGERQLAFYIQKTQEQNNTPTSHYDEKPSTNSCDILVEDQPTEISGLFKVTQETDSEHDDNWKPEQSDEDAHFSDSSKSEKSITEQCFKKRKPKQKRIPEIHDPCKVCGRFFRSKHILVKHAASHENNPKGICGVCGDQVESPEDLRSHLDTHLKLQYCDTCGQAFITVIALEKHIGTHSNETEKELTCQICQNTFANEKLLRKHKLEHRGRPYKCKSCPKSFVFKSFLDTHSKTHTGDKPHCCDICGKHLTNFRSLSRHRLIHTGQKEYSCKQCGKRFPYLAKVKEHEKIHFARERNFLCDICSKAFYTAQELSIHQHTHDGKHIVKCTVCNKLLRGNLKAHMMTHTGEKPFRCSECGWKFRSKAHLRNHVTTTHQGIKAFICKVCGKPCGRQWYLDVHMRIHTGEKPYKCTVCDRAFSQSHCLKTHMKSHQGEQ